MSGTHSIQFRAEALQSLLERSDCFVRLGVHRLRALHTPLRRPLNLFVNRTHGVVHRLRHGRDAAIDRAKTILQRTNASVDASHPLLQMFNTLQSAKLVGPVEALRLTSGFRWPLILASFALGAINRIVPASSATDEFTTVCLLAAIGGVVSMFSAMFGLSVSVAAWRLMTTARGPMVA